MEGRCREDLLEISLHPVETIYRLYKHFGFSDALRVGAQLLSGRTQGITLSTVKAPLFLRPRTSDLAVFSEIFLKRLYDVRVPTEPATIIDAGANVGLASTFLANRFPEARIFALEPFAANLTLLKRNTSYYPNVQCIEAALWKEDGFVKIEGEAERAWGAQAKELADSELGGQPSLSVNTALSKWNIQTVDIFKIDIEGSEKEVFNADPEAWLPRVKILIIEIHDRKRPGCSKAVFGALSRANFSCRIRGDNLVCYNLDHHPRK